MAHLIFLHLIQILGTPTEETWPGITNNTEFVSGHYSVYHPEPLSLHAPRLDKDATDLLGKLLHFESRNRIQAKQALAHPYFQSLGQRIFILPNSELQTLAAWDTMESAWDTMESALDTMESAWSLHGTPWLVSC